LTFEINIIDDQQNIYNKFYFPLINKLFSTNKTNRKTKIQMDISDGKSTGSVSLIRFMNYLNRNNIQYLNTDHILNMYTLNI